MGKTTLKIPAEKLEALTIRNIEVILTHQDSKTGLFRASTKRVRVVEGHYHHAWIRDSAAILNGLLTSRQFSDEKEYKNELTSAICKSLDGILEILGRQRWQRAFAQKIIDRGRYTHLSEEAPPVHLKLNGEICEWRQNQPDSWGSFLVVIGRSFDQGTFWPNADQKKILSSIVKFLCKLQIEKFSASSMWEDAEVKDPPSLSTAIIVQEGLKRIRKLFALDVELLRVIDRKIHAVDLFVSDNYPEDLTFPSNDDGVKRHQSRTDLATLVAMSYSDHSLLPITKYLALANVELGNGQLPGKIRFRGDPYYYHGIRKYKGSTEDPSGKEAVWRMAKKLEAVIFLKRALRAFAMGSDGEILRAMGNKRLMDSILDGQLIGYDAELMYWKNGKLIPNRNDLLWNRALMVEAAALSQEASKF